MYVEQMATTLTSMTMADEGSCLSANVLMIPLGSKRRDPFVSLAHAFTGGMFATSI